MTNATRKSKKKSTALGAPVAKNNRLIARPDALMLQATDNFVFPVDARKKYLRGKANQYLQAGYLSLSEFNVLTGRTWLYRNNTAPTMSTILTRGLHMAPVLYRLQQATRPDGTMDKAILRTPATQIPEEYLQHFLTQLAEEYLAVSRQDAMDSIDALLARLRRLRGLQAARETKAEQSATNAKQRAVLASISDDDPTGVLSEWKPSAFDPRVDPAHPAHETVSALDAHQQMMRLPDPFIGSEDLRYFLERAGWWFYQVGLIPKRSRRALLLAAWEQYERTPAMSRSQTSNPANQIRYWCYGKKTKVLRTTAEPVLKYLLELVVAADETLDDAVVSQLLRASEQVVDMFLTSPRTSITFLDTLPVQFGQPFTNALPPTHPASNTSRPNAAPPDGIPSPAITAPPAPVREPSTTPTAFPPPPSPSPRLTPAPTPVDISPALLADWQALTELADTDSPDAPRVDAEEVPIAAPVKATGVAATTVGTAMDTVSTPPPASSSLALPRPASFPPPDYRIDPETGVLTDYTVYPDDADIDLIWQHNGGLPLSLDDVKALV
jgi:hypothetical protein|nr:MAG TPA: hypothetical protein [Caudoviricetes sp.]